jgi:hypothetical protein
MSAELQTESIHVAAELLSRHYEVQSGKWAAVYALARFLIRGDNTTYVLIRRYHGSNGVTDSKRITRSLRKVLEAERRVRQLPLFPEATL